MRKLIVLLILSCGMNAAQAATITLSATADSVVLDGDSTNYDGQNVLASELGTPVTDPVNGNIWSSLLKFDLSSAVGYHINSASLSLTSFFNHSTGTFVHDVYSSSDDSWTETGVNGINRPVDATLTLLDSININGDSKTYNWNVLTGVTNIGVINGSDTLLTLLIRPDLSQLGNVFGPHFNARNSTSGAPMLTLDLSPIAQVDEPAGALLWLGGLLALGLGRKRHMRNVHA